jgi:hypothetical protein
LTAEVAVGRSDGYGRDQRLLGCSGLQRRGHGWLAHSQARRSRNPLARRFTLSIGGGECTHQGKVRKGGGRIAPVHC